MKVIVKGVHLKVSPRLREFVEAHLAEPIGTFYDSEAAELQVHLVDINGPKGGEDKECRVTVFMPGFSPIHVVEATDNIYKSVALVRERVERLAKKELGRLRKHSGHPVSKPLARSREGFAAWSDVPEVHLPEL